MTAEAPDGFTDIPERQTCHSPDGRRRAGFRTTGGHEDAESSAIYYEIAVWDAASGEELYRTPYSALENHRLGTSDGARIHSLSFSPDGSEIEVNGGGKTGTRIAYQAIVEAVAKLLAAHPEEVARYRATPLQSPKREEIAWFFVNALRGTAKSRLNPAQTLRHLMERLNA